mgnify:CR=1 FL=1
MSHQLRATRKIFYSQLEAHSSQLRITVMPLFAFDLRLVLVSGEQVIQIGFFTHGNLE